jgi:ribosomal protein S7
MEQKTLKNISKKKLWNHVTKSGKKQISERMVAKSFKLSQKYQKKNLNEIIKLSIMSSIPAFKIVKLTNKKRRKKSIREIPTFVSNHESRISWSLKNVIKGIIAQKTKRSTLATELKKEYFLLAQSESKVVTLKDDIQNRSLKEKKYFRFYRW